MKPTIQTVAIITLMDLLTRWHEIPDGLWAGFFNDTFRESGAVGPVLLVEVGDELHGKIHSYFGNDEAEYLCDALNDTFQDIATKAYIAI
jgi:hypothetical protein